ncbi:hypothetical protein [Halocatena marina]|uniref:hypothetical protein n=1 Tax=Halocatena marina TaxID=2934937 RepID=UPI0020100F80|nr:hypothetical protein [Halocatena marina]
MTKTGLEAVVDVMMSSGRHDLVLSVGGSGSLLVPSMIDPVLTQVGVSEAEQVLCSGGFNISQLTVVGFGLLSMYLILKGLIRMIVGLDIVGKPEIVGSDGIRRTDAVDPYGRQKAKGGVYSIVAAIFPIFFVPVFLNVIGIDVAGCLLP